MNDALSKGIEALKAEDRNSRGSGIQRQEGMREPRDSSDPLEGEALKGRTPWTDRGETPPGGETKRPRRQEGRETLQMPEREAW